MGMHDQGGPYAVDAKAGSQLHLCGCGRTGTPPYCDGSHQAAGGAGPVTHAVEKDCTLYVCGCGRSRNAPWCDGSHSG